MRRLLGGLLVATLVLAGSAQAHPLHGKLLTSWTLSHTSHDDPLISPGQPGAAHQHCFIGNTTTNAFSTGASLLNGATTAKMRDNKSAYWVPPIVFPDGDTFCPTGAGAYYGSFGKNTANIAGGAVQPPPLNLGFVTGNSASTVRQPIGVTYWRCSGATPTYLNPPTSCPANSKLTMEFRSPSCWDGTRFRSPNGRDHMSYPVFINGTPGCPATHPVAVPQVEMGWHYPLEVSARLGEAWRLDSDRPGTPKGSSAHMDTLWAWLASGPEMTECLNDPNRSTATTTICGLAGTDTNIFNSARDISDWALPIA